MKKLGVIFIALLTVSCAVPYEVNLHELDVDLTCLSPKQEMYINMDFDRCPFMSENPRPRSHYWELLRVSELTSKENLSSDSKVENANNCTAGVESSQQYLLRSDTKLFVDSMVIRTDTVSYNRLLIYGRTTHMNREFNWIFDSNENPESHVIERVKANFNICQTSN
jgi:hypothetical protein